MVAARGPLNVLTHLGEKSDKSPCGESGTRLVGGNKRQRMVILSTPSYKPQNGWKSLAGSNPALFANFYQTGEIMITKNEYLVFPELKEFAKGKLFIKSDNLNEYEKLKDLLLHVFGLKSYGDSCKGDQNSQYQTSADIFAKFDEICVSGTDPSAERYDYSECTKTHYTSTPRISCKAFMKAWSNHFKENFNGALE